MRKKTGKHKSCLQCGKLFYVKKSWIHKTKFCSKQCASSFRCDKPLKSSGCFKNGGIPWNKGTTGIVKRNSGTFRKGKEHPNYTGVWFNNGYKHIRCEGHPYAIKGKWVKEHRLIMEKHIGRILEPREIVHHINHNRLDNRIENLMLFENRSLHQRLHEQIKHKNNNY